MSLVTTAIVDNSKCQYCGMIHGSTCPRISAIEYHENGQVKRVEFFDALGANGRTVQTDWPFAAGSQGPLSRKGDEGF